jgi:hypothetical protein
MSGKSASSSGRGAGGKSFAPDAPKTGGSRVQRALSWVADQQD